MHGIWFLPGKRKKAADRRGIQTIFGLRDPASCFIFDRFAGFLPEFTFSR